jgi:hypothetical protein
MQYKLRTSRRAHYTDALNVQLTLPDLHLAHGRHLTGRVVPVRDSSPFGYILSRIWAGWMRAWGCLGCVCVRPLEGRRDERPCCQFGRGEAGRRHHKTRKKWRWCCATYSPGRCHSASLLAPQSCGANQCQVRLAAADCVQVAAHVLQSLNEVTCNDLYEVITGTNDVPHVVNM